MGQRRWNGATGGSGGGGGSLGGTANRCSRNSRPRIRWWNWKLQEQLMVVAAVAVQGLSE
jgi:hypothetical protein